MKTIEQILMSANLPTLPGVAVKLLAISRDPEASVRDVVDVVKADPAIAARILKSTNSSLLGLSHKVTSLDQAVSLLGIVGVTSLALSFSLVDASLSGAKSSDHFRTYWMQSVVQAFAAEKLCPEDKKRMQGSEYFLAGLLADIGQLALLKTSLEEYSPVLAAADLEQQPLHEVERRMLGFTHIELGVDLMKNWGLAEIFVDVVQFSHEPPEVLSAAEHTAPAELLDAIAKATAIGDYYCSSAKGQALSRLHALCNNDEAYVEELLEQIRQRLYESAELFDVDPATYPSTGELLAQANAQLAELAVRQHIENSQAIAHQKQIELEKAELELKNQELKAQTIRDALTNIYNRSYFDQCLEQEISRCQRQATSIGVIFIDIDHFKRLNDTYGHQFGDEVLTKVAGSLRNNVRKTDVVARYGGEEMIILVHQPTEKGLQKLSDRLRERIEGLPLNYQGQPVTVTVSVGTSFCVPARNAQGIGQHMVAAADEAMYCSKRAGRNRVTHNSLVSDLQRDVLTQLVQLQYSRWLVNRKLFSVAQMSEHLSHCRTAHVLLGELAKQENMLTEEHVGKILEAQVESDERFGAIAVDLGYLTVEQLAYLLALQKENPADLSNVLVERGAVAAQDAELILREYYKHVPRPNFQESADLVSI